MSRAIRAVFTVGDATGLAEFQDGETLEHTGPVNITGTLTATSFSGAHDPADIIGFGAAGGILVSNGAAWVRAASATITSAGAASFTTLGVTGALTVTGTGPHAIGGAAASNTRLSFKGSFSGGASSVLLGQDFLGALTAPAGATAWLTGTRFTNSITTQSNSETIGVISQLRIEEPQITKGSDTVTAAITLHIVNQATEGASNFALKVESGHTEVQTLTATSAVTMASTLGVAGILSTTDATEATSAVAASLKTAGGFATVKGLWIGGASRLVGAVTMSALAGFGAGYVKVDNNGLLSWSAS